MHLIFNINYRFAVLLVITSLLFLSFLGSMDIWDVDEGMHAAMAKTIVASGDWVTPRVNGDAFLDKPILFNWLTAVSLLIFGLSETAARLPAALAGIACVLLTWDLARTFYGERAGFIAGLVLATSLEFLILARLVQYDIPFTLFVTLALYAFAKATVNRSATATRGRQNRYFLLFSAASAMAVLTKGPLGLVLPLIVIAGFLVVTASRPDLSKSALLLGAGMFIALVVPWFFLMERANSGYLNYFMVTQHVGNVVGGSGELSARHPEPFFYYIPVLFAGMFPWSIALPQAITGAVRSFLAKNDRSALFFLLWIALTLLLLSAATSKLSTYILPMFPAAAILLGRYFSLYLTNPRADIRRGLLLGATCLLAPAFMVVAYVLPTNPPPDSAAHAGIIWSEVEAIVMTLTVAWLIFAALLLRSKIRLALGTMSAIAPVLAFYLLLVMVPDVDPYKGTRELSARMEELLPADQRIPMYGQFLDSTLFYTDRQALMLHTDDEILAFLDSPERRYVLLRYRDDGKAEAIENDYHVIEKLGNKAIISNQPY